MMKSRFILSNEKNLGERRKGSRYHATRTLILAPGGRATPSQSLVPLWGLFPRVERPTAGRGPHRSPGAAWPAEAGRAGALTLSSWATWAFCRYTEYRKAVTTELVPRRMNWPSEGRPPLSMAAPSPGEAGALERPLAPQPPATRNHTPGDDSSRKPAASRPPKAQHPEPEGDPEPEGGGGGRAQQTGRCCCHGNGQASAASAGVGSPGVGSAEWFAELERSLVAPRPLQLWP